MEYPTNLPLTTTKHQKKLRSFRVTKALELEATDPLFPRRVRIGERLTAWRTDDLIRYIETQSCRVRPALPLSTR